jgi:ferredoxin
MSYIDDRDCINCKNCIVIRYVKVRRMISTTEQWVCGLGVLKQTECMFAGTDDHFEKGKAKVERRKINE